MIATLLTPGAVVTCRDRHWVVLPSDDPNLMRLRPLSGNEDQSSGIFLPLNLETIDLSEFPSPHASDLKDLESARLLMDAARLSLRSGAGPFRSLGRLSIRPRPYQLVPLLMALRLETVRLLIADDVGIGKTIEAGLIARELLDRGEIQRIAVLCPPHLCDQWQRELRQKFHIDAVVVRSGTISKLERDKPPGDTPVFGYYRHLVVSLDYAKSEIRKATFLSHCPDFVIIDEAHTCAQAGGKAVSQQQRHQLLQALSDRPHQHLLLLTATPHSGIETSFLSLLGLLNTKFETWQIDQLTQNQRIELAAHFVQRRRVDVQQWLGAEDQTPFPERVSEEKPYRLSKEYRSLFDGVYDFARGLVKDATADMSYSQRRGRYWAALALIRCVMSSPQAAVATLGRQAQKVTVDGSPTLVDLDQVDDALMANYTQDPTDQEQTMDVSPSHPLDQVEAAYTAADRRKLKGFIQLAEALKGKKDSKVQEAIQVVDDLLKEGYNPILWCRYIDTATYVAEQLQEKFEKKRGNLRVQVIHGERSGDEREALLAELTEAPQRILVATDCLSEGVNLQEHFNAVIHYDLPWNPNRLEQRGGRVDRYGQVSPQVKTYLLYGQDNPVDGAVLEVLIRKAVEIHRTLGITVPVPMDSAAVSEAVFKSLFDRATDNTQLSLLDLADEDSKSPVEQVHTSWDRAVEREKVNRTRFAQRTIKPEEVAQELEESDAVLGNEKDVERFVLAGYRRLKTSLIDKKQGWLLPHIPPVLQPQLGNQERMLTFSHPAPENVEYVGRNHPLVEGLAQYLLEGALASGQDAPAGRCGYFVTTAVTQHTVLLLLRLRHLLTVTRKQQTDLLTEECVVVGFEGSISEPCWLAPEQALNLFQTAETVPDGMPAGLKQHQLQNLLGQIQDLESALDEISDQRAQALSQSHKRVRKITKEGAVKVQAQRSRDLLGVYILNPSKGR